MKCRINIFNRLTHPELPETTLFERILEKHYRKFVLFYDTLLISQLTDSIDTIECEKEDDNSLTIFFTTDRSMSEKDIKEMLLSKINDHRFINCFKVTGFKNGKGVTLHIVNRQILGGETI